MNDRDIAALVLSAERRWMDNWVAGPTLEGEPIRRGALAPDMDLTDETGNEVKLSQAWSDGPALIMLWRHLGCGCGIQRISRLEDEYEGYETSGLNAVVVAPGDLERVVAYKEMYGLRLPVLADPGYKTHRAYGLSHWSKEQALYNRPDEYCTLTPEMGRKYQETARESGTVQVDDPWMQSAEFVVDPAGLVRVAYYYNYCEDYPDPRVFETAARLVAFTS